MENNSDKGNHLSRCSVLRFSNIVSSLSIEQQDAVREIGFGSLLDKRSITVHGMEYKLTPETFTSVMGVGDRGTPIVLGGENSEITDLRAKYCSGKKGIPIAAYINPSYLYALKDVSNIRGKNWANWSFNFLWDEVSKFNENKISSMNGCVIFLMLFYMSSTKFRCEKSVAAHHVLKVTDKLTMVTPQVMGRIEEHMRRNNDLLQKMGLKMDSLTEKVETLERAYFRQEGTNVADDSQSLPTYTGAEATDGPIFSSPNMEMHPLIHAIVTLSDLVREKHTPIEVKERKVVYLSTSTDEEAVLKEKLVEVLQDTIKPKLVPELEDESFAQQEKKCQQSQDFNSLSLGPPQPYRNRKQGRYQLSPYDQVSHGPKPKYRAGPFP
ncbi:hypothetical protein CUMW_262600 [Citrus unshiu]|uniref:Uncharacterized protein n=1 Tax=Citrus unshiu TaxID=55188 RepID=A0A2H5QUE5_CITUN|nr:hypothetical protein CUMW_262600 [Citrus unshiu]